MPGVFLWIVVQSLTKVFEFFIEIYGVLSITEVLRIGGE
jgi:hypothetical protein